MEIIDQTHTFIALRCENHYGTKFYYVVDENIKHQITNLTGRKTITDTDMSALQALGFAFRLQDEPMPSWSV